MTHHVSYSLVLCLPTLLGDHVLQRMDVEVNRMGYDMQNAWRISDLNSNYKYVTVFPLFQGGHC